MPRPHPRPLNFVVRFIVAIFVIIVVVNGNDAKAMLMFAVTPVPNAARALEHAECSVLQTQTNYIVVRDHGLVFVRQNVLRHLSHKLAGNHLQAC